MSATYWKSAGENIARGLGEKTIRKLGIGGKFIGRAGAVGWHGNIRLVDDTAVLRLILMP